MLHLCDILSNFDVLLHVSEFIPDVRDVLTLSVVNHELQSCISNAAFFKHYMYNTHNFSVEDLQNDLSNYAVEDTNWWKDETFWRHWNFPCAGCWGVPSGQNCHACDLELRLEKASPYEHVKEYQKGECVKYLHKGVWRLYYAREHIQSFHPTMGRWQPDEYRKPIKMVTSSVTRKFWMHICDIMFIEDKPRVKISRIPCWECHVNAAKMGCVSLSCKCCCRSPWCLVHK